MSLSTRPLAIQGPAQGLRILFARLARHLRASAATRRRRSYYRRLIGA